MELRADVRVSEEELCDAVRKLLAYVSPGGVVLLASAKIDIETDRKIVEEEVRNDKEEQVS